MKPNHAVILMALGGLESLDDIVPFLKRIMKGREPSEAQIAEIRERYSLVGGKSPLNEITKKQAALLAKKFSDSGEELSVFPAFLFTPPYIGDVLNEISDLGIENVTALNIAPQRSERMICYYREAIDEAIAEMKNPPNFKMLNGYHDDKNLLKGMSEKIQEKLGEIEDGKTLVIFSAHSLPVRPEDKTDIYVQQIDETVQGIIQHLGDVEYTFGYQSKGFSRGEWLEPSVDYLIENLPADVENVLFASVGFVSDNLENIYDLDIEYKKKIEAQGKRFFRAESLNTSPHLIEAFYTRLEAEGI